MARSSDAMEKKGQHWAKGQLGQQIFNDKNRTNQPTHSDAPRNKYIPTKKPRTTRNLCKLTKNAYADTKCYTLNDSNTSSYRDRDNEVKYSLELFHSSVPSGIGYLLDRLRKIHCPLDNAEFSLGMSMRFCNPFQQRVYRTRR